MSAARTLTLTQDKASSPRAYQTRSNESQDVLLALGEFLSVPEMDHDMSWSASPTIR
jgi:hypothetical protein